MTSHRLADNRDVLDFGSPVHQAKEIAGAFGIYQAPDRGREPGAGDAGHPTLVTSAAGAVGASCWRGVWADRSAFAVRWRAARGRYDYRIGAVDEFGRPYAAFRARPPPR